MIAIAMLKEEIQNIIFYSMIFLFAFTACNSNIKGESKQTEITGVSDNKLTESNTDTLLMKYRAQNRPAGYDGIMMYDLLKLTNTPDDKILSELRKTDKNWEANSASEKAVYQNKNYNQLLQRRDEVVLFFVDYSQYHLNNVNFLKENGHFDYDNPSIGISYFTCDSIIVAWRLNDNKDKGGSSMMLYNIE